MCRLQDYNSKVEALFRLRSNDYEKETSWVTDENFMRPLLPDGFMQGKVLDLCAGTGIIANYFNSLGFEVIATDICQEMLGKTKEGIQRVLADAHNLPFDSNYFDLVTCRQGLHYLDLNIAFETMIRITSKYISLGHITAHSKEDVEVWKHYFSIAAPCRKEIFYPGQIVEKGESLGLTIRSSYVTMNAAGLYGPIAHLDNESKRILFEILNGAPDGFKKRNSLRLKDGKLYSKRRWEFIVFTKDKPVLV